MNRKLPQIFFLQKFCSINFLMGILSLLFSVNTAFGQTIGDYRSAPSTATTPGAWTSLSSWQYYNGPATGWLTPTVAQGYPGEKSNGIDEAVTILAGHTIIIGDGSGSDFNTQPMGKITITGKLYLDGNINNPTPRFELDAQWVYVTPNVGIIEFNDKVNLWLISSLYPGTGLFTVNKDESTGYKSIIGDCSNNQDINFGPNATSYCAGKKFTFDDLMSSGGSLNAIIGPIPAVCQGNSVSLTGSYEGLIGTPVVYGWHIVDSFGNTQDFSGANVSFPNATGTFYTIKLTVSTVYSSTPFTNSETITVSVNPAQTAPVATAGTGLSCTSVRANWQAVSGATSYVLDVATNSGFTSMVTNYNAVNVGNVLFSDITGLTSGTTYYYRVRAFNGTCNSLSSNVITVVVPSIPAAPTGLANGEVRCNHVDLNWNAVSGATSYTVQRATDIGFTTSLVTVTGVTSTAYTFNGLSMGTNYYFRVRAVNSCAGTNSSAIGPLLTLNTPVQPTNVGSNTVLCAQFNVTWTDVAGAANYTVQVSTDPAFPTAGLMSFPGLSAPSYTVTGLSTSTTYYYRVIAVNGCGSGTPVNGPASVTTIASEPGVPNLEAPTVGCNQLTVNWTADPLAVDYTVELATNPGFPSGLISTVSSITGTSHTFTNLVPGTTYYYRVSARNGCGFSDYGTPSPASLTTGVLPATPIITASGSTAICQGSKVTLTSNADFGNVWSTGETSKSIDVTVAGNYTVQVVNSGGCVSPVSALTAVTVQAKPTAVAGGIETICFNSSATVSGASASNGTIQWTKSGGAGTLTNGTSITPIYTPLLGGPSETVLLTLTVTGINSCASEVATASHTINVQGGVPTVSDVEISCNATSFALSSLAAASGVTDYRIDVAKDDTFSAASLIITDFSLGNVSPQTTVVNGLAQGGTYYFRVRTVSACGTSASSIPAIVSVKRTFYNGTSWVPATPDASTRAVFTGGTVIPTPIIACSCQINSGVNMVVGTSGGANSDAILHLVNGLDVLGSGTLTFENNASLVQDNDAIVNSGPIIYKRISAPMNNFDYTYWSSPVVGQTLKELVPNTLPDKYFMWGTTNWVGVNAFTVMGPPGRGYIIRTPKPGVYGGTYPETVVMPYREPVQFVGIPNNGAYTLAINTTGLYNLIGNPYPSALSADDFLEENAVTNKRLAGTLYFWTHNTAVSTTGYSSADYATYNLSGGVATRTPATSPGTGVGAEAPSGNIAAGQSFFVASGLNVTPVVFNNAMRVGLSNSNSQFFRGTKSKTAAIERNRVWLNMSNAGGAFKQLLVGYITGATNGYDSAYDGVSLDGNIYIDFYSINENKNLTIQGRALPFDVNDQVPLGYRTTIAGTFDISIDHADGSLLDQPIYVEDKLTSVIHNLKNGPYSFSTAIGTFKERFVLRYSDKAAGAALGNATFDEQLKGFVVSVKNHKIKINSFDETIDNVMVYDLKGSLLYQKNHLKTNEFVIPNFHSSDQFLIVMTQLTSGKWITKEIVF